MILLIFIYLYNAYSILDGICKLDPLMKRAKELNMKAITQIDHGHSGGVLAFQKAARKEGIKPILGAELYFNPDAKIIALPSEYRNAICIKDMFINESEYKIDVEQKKKDKKDFKEYKEILTSLLEKDNCIFPDQEFVFKYYSLIMNSKYIITPNIMEELLYDAYNEIFSDEEV